MATELLTLGKMLLDLIQRKGELDKQYFEQFIEPVWISFVKIHDNYKKTFKEYTDSILMENTNVEDIIQRIREDSIYTRDLRSDLQGMVIALDSQGLKLNDEQLSRFIYDIVYYFDSANQNYIFYDNAVTPLSHGGFAIDIRNTPRTFAYRRLRDKVGISKAEMRDIFLLIISDLQHSYDKVATDYFQLRAKLLS